MAKSGSYSVFVAVEVGGNGVFVSETKVGLAGKVGVSGRTIHRVLSRVGWSVVGKWRVCEVEVVRSQVKGDSSRLPKYGTGY